MKRLIVCLLILFIANVLHAAPVYVPDSNLKAAIEATLGISDPDANDMLLLTNLRADANGISDLTGLETATNLKSLRLNQNMITILSPLHGLTKLTYLNLNDNDITNITPIQPLTKLKYLYLSRNKSITDINAISDMNNLSELGLTDVNLSTITPLADVNQVKYLWLSYNFIEDISPLTNYKNRTRINFYYNPLSFESWTTYLKTIMDNNPSGTIGCNVLLDNRSADMNDLRTFVSKWLRQDCDWSNGDCSGADFDESGIVDFWDFAVLADWWMYGS
ncbi:MAG: leucine-rich repeat domain-containing protein [Phycisphaerae bacterium]|nr:leucine-rich repeat domain-containing protein [Phycisphaerae bacterium]